MLGHLKKLHAMVSFWTESRHSDFTERSKQQANEERNTTTIESCHHQMTLKRTQLWKITPQKNETKKALFQTSRGKRQVTLAAQKSTDKHASDWVLRDGLTFISNTQNIIGVSTTRFNNLCQSIERKERKWTKSYVDRFDNSAIILWTVSCWKKKSSNMQIKHN